MNNNLPELVILYVNQKYFKHFPHFTHHSNMFKEEKKEHKMSHTFRF